MKKKSILILGIILFLSSFCFGQSTITKQDFEKLVDYSNCKYVQAFIEKNDASKPYFEDYYLKKVKPELNKVNLDSFQTILKHEKIVELLSNNTPALQLAKKFNERKLKYADFQDNESLLQSLITSGWNSVDLSKTASKIQNEISVKYSSVKGKNNVNFSESDVVRAQTIQTTSQVEELQLKLNQLQEQYEILTDDTKMLEYQKSLKNLKTILYGGLGILFLLFIAVVALLKKLTSRENIIKHVLNSQRLEEKFNTKENSQTSNQTSRTNRTSESYKLTEIDINLIVDRVLECKRLSDTENQKDYKDTKKEIFESSKASYKYLKGKTGKIFSRAENSPENSFFRLYDERDNSALFEFNGDDAEAIANRIFSDDVCNIISGGYQNAQKVITSKPGKIKRIGDQWEVFEPVQIKLV
jgi:hypothetical protein